MKGSALAGVTHPRGVAVACIVARSDKPPCEDDEDDESDGDDDGGDEGGTLIFHVVNMVMPGRVVSSQAIEQPLRVAILAHGKPVAPLETGKGIDAVGILCDSTRDAHGVRHGPAIAVPIPSRKAESLLGGREGLSGEVACPLAHIPIMSILFPPSRVNNPHASRPG